MNTNIKERFDEASSKYRTDSYVWRAKSAEMVSKLVSPQANDIILDIGCGTGIQIIELSKIVKLAIGIDISDGMIEQVRKNANNANRDNVKFYIGTFENPEKEINLKEQGITKIISNYALHHLNLQEKQDAFKKMIDIGGESLQTIVIGDLMFFENPDDYKEDFENVAYGPGDDQPSTVEDLTKCFSGLGFNIEIHKLHPLVGVLEARKG